MTPKKITYTLLIILIIIMGIESYLLLIKKSAPVQTQTTEQETSITYKNTEYGFNFSLPVSWKGYSIIVDKWQGQIIGDTTTTQLEGPKIIIRHPLWTAEVPRQDIPIMVFNLSEWALIEQEKLSVGAAPIGPSELGHNNNYVFALPARYNFAFPVGYEEVDNILQNNPLSVF
jgi:hypothetical protein